MKEDMDTGCRVETSERVQSQCHISDLRRPAAEGETSPTDTAVTTRVCQSEWPREMWPTVSQSTYLNPFSHQPPLLPPPPPSPTYNQHLIIFFSNSHWTFALQKAFIIIFSSSYFFKQKKKSFPRKIYQNTKLLFFVFFVKLEMHGLVFFSSFFLVAVFNLTSFRKPRKNRNNKNKKEE